MIAVLATVQGSLLLAWVVKANMHHLLSYIMSLWLNSFIVDADVPLRSLPPFFFLSSFAHFMKNCDSVVCSQICTW